MNKKSWLRLSLRWLPPLVLAAVFFAFVWYLNGADKVPLVSREGQAFEKGVVTEVLQDNLQADGSRVGEQVVRVKMTTGVLTGEEVEMTSSSGYLFGAPCTVGIDIPSNFLMANYTRKYGLADWARSRYEAMAHHAGECVACGACEKRCPFQVPVVENMRQAAQVFGR